MALQKAKDVVISLVQSVDLDLLKAKMAYFFYLGSLGSIYPIMSLYMRSRGLSKPLTGVLMSTRPFISFLALPLAGILADRLQIHKKLLIGFCVLSVVFRLFMISEPWLAWIAVFFMLTELVGTPVSALLDAGVIELLGPERRSLYGKQRVWGSLSFGGVALAIGAVVSAAGGNFNIYFWNHSVMALIGAFIFLFLSVNSVSTPAPLWQSLGIVFSSIHVFVFFLLITMIGVATGIIGAYLFIMLDELNASRLTMGLATATACLAEMPFLFFSAPLLRTLGERNMLYLACIGGIIRLVWYTFMTNPWLVIIAETMHGPFFGALWVAAMSYVHKITPPGLGATGQGLMAGLYGGLGNGLGSLVGGVVYQRFGYVVLFRGTAVWLCFGLIIFFGTNAFFKQVNLDEIGHAVTVAAIPEEDKKANGRKTLELEIQQSEDDTAYETSTNTPSPTSSNSSDSTEVALELP
jgi:MFS family permease